MKQRGGVATATPKIRDLAIEYKDMAGHEDEMNAVVALVNEGKLDQAAKAWASLPDPAKLILAADIGAIGSGRIVAAMAGHLGIQLKKGPYSQVRKPAASPSEK